MPLASPGSPYVQRDGQVVAPKETVDAIESGEISVGAPIARSYSSKKRRSITDLPADPKTQTAVIVVLNYSLLGMSDNEIAHLVNISIDDVQKLKKHPAYQETFEMLFFELISANSNSLQARIASMAPKALDSLLDVMENGKQEVARVRASDSVLDRSGLRAEELYQQANNSGMDSLNIVFTDEADNKTSVEVNIGGKNGNRSR